MIGVPRNFKTSAPVPLIFIIATIDAIAISKTGTKIGAKDSHPLGSLPYSATSSSYVFVTSPESASSSAFTLLPINLA